MGNVQCLLCLYFMYQIFFIVTLFTSVPLFQYERIHIIPRFCIKTNTSSLDPTLSFVLILFSPFCFGVFDHF